MRKLLLFVSLFLFFPIISQAEDLDKFKLPKVEKKDWRFKEFPIIAWWPPPGTATLQDFNNYRDAGFNLYPANPDEGFETSIKLASKAGLKLMPFRDCQGFGLEEIEVVFPEKNRRVVGWITHDEPMGYDRVKSSIRAVNKLMREDPTRWTFFNFLPPHVQVDPDTWEIIDAAVPNGMPILSYDNYVILADGSNRDKQHFDNLRIFRKASLHYDVPFWAFALSIKHAMYRRPSESDIRWKQYTNLAYGAKGLWYFTYWGPTDWERWDNIAIVDPKDGSKTELYEQVKTLNRSISKMGKTLLGLTSTGVFHTDPPKGHRPLKKGKFWIADVTAKDALVGFFKDKRGNDYALVVNKLHGMDLSSAETADSIQLEFSPDVKSVKAVNWLDGNTGYLYIENGKSTLNIYGGTGVLLKARS